VSVFNQLVKLYAYFFHLALSTFLIGIAIVATTAHEALHLDMLPFNQERMISRVSMMSLIGFICIFLALVKIFEIVFPVWSLVLLVILTWGFFFTQYSFHGVISLAEALLLLVATSVAFYGSLMVLIPERRNRW
jgi:hypothetical protein